MPISRRKAALSGANLMVFSGQVTAKELLSKFGDIDADQPDSAQNWLIVDIGGADISELDFDVLSKLKALLAPKMMVMKARRDFDVAIVCGRPLNEPIYRVWKIFVGDDERYPSKPLLFPDLRSACDRLGYSEAERQEVFALSGAAQ